MKTFACMQGDRIAVGDLTSEVVSVQQDRVRLGLVAPEEVLRQIREREERVSHKPQALWEVDT